MGRLTRSKVSAAAETRSAQVVAVVERRALPVELELPALPAAAAKLLPV